MDPGLVVAILLAAAFATTNGLHDASNAIATLVATGAATPLQGIVLASVFNLLGPLLLGAAVADTIGGIVTVAPSAAIEVIGSGLVGAVAWNLVTWRLGLPSSSGHALVGGLVGAALAVSCPEKLTVSASSRAISRICPQTSCRSSATKSATSRDAASDTTRIEERSLGL